MLVKTITITAVLGNTDTDLTAQVATIHHSPLQLYTTVDPNCESVITEVVIELHIS